MSRPSPKKDCWGSSSKSNPPSKVACPTLPISLPEEDSLGMLGLLWGPQKTASPPRDWRTLAAGDLPWESLAGLGPGPTVGPSEAYTDPCLTLFPQEEPCGGGLRMSGAQGNPSYTPPPGSLWSHGTWAVPCPPMTSHPSSTWAVPAMTVMGQT